jgi:hypothetical protein
MPSQNQLLNVAKEHDVTIYGRYVQINKAIQDAGVITVLPGVPSHELTLVDADEDPFLGNRNNRRVAARIAVAFKSKKFLNQSNPTHVGDPEKAAADVERSLQLNPDPQIADPEMLPALPALPPSVGSPASKKAAQKPAGAPAAWKPNA